MRYLLKIIYDGTCFSGWQVQPNGVSIQALVEKVLSTILREPISIAASGRTDAGVHALGQMAHFDTEKDVNPFQLLYAVNCLLPQEIRLLQLNEVPDDFHARYSAKGKTYRYHLELGSVQNPFKREYQWHVRGKCQLSLLKECVPYLVGIHDFTSFANEAHQGAAAKGAVRHLRRFEIIEDGSQVTLEFEADGFLYKMVRNIVGTCVDIAQEKKAPSDLPAILEAKDRRLAGRAAPAHGLFLVHVQY